MPPRRRRSKRRFQTLTLDIMNDLTVGPCDRWSGALRPPPFKDDEERRQAWLVHRHDLMTNRMPGTTGPWAFWYFDGPDYLRDFDDALEDTFSTIEQFDSAYEALEAERMRWLAEHPSPTEWFADENTSTTRRRSAN